MIWLFLVEQYWGFSWDFFSLVEYSEIIFTSNSQPTQNSGRQFPAHVYETSSTPFLKTEVSLWKPIKCSPSMIHRRRHFSRKQSRAILDLYLGKARIAGYHDYRNVIVFWKLRFQDVFMHNLTTDAESVVFSIPPVWGAFSWRISVDGRPNWRRKIAFSNAFCVV